MSTVTHVEDRGIGAKLGDVSKLRDGVNLLP